MMTLKNLRCPQCRQPTNWEGNEFRPFCSERCRLLDLGAWADESYRVTGSAQNTVDDSEENPHENN